MINFPTSNWVPWFWGCNYCNLHLLNHIFPLIQPQICINLLRGNYCDNNNFTCNVSRLSSERYCIGGSNDVGIVHCWYCHRIRRVAGKSRIAMSGGCREDRVYHLDGAHDKLEFRDQLAWVHVFPWYGGRSSPNTINGKLAKLGVYQKIIV